MRTHGLAAVAGLVMLAGCAPRAGPVVSVVSSYPGESAPVVLENVTAPIEQQLQGLDGLVEVRSQSGSDGLSRVVLTFSPETDPDRAAQAVRERVALAQPTLPAAVAPP